VAGLFAVASSRPIPSVGALPRACLVLWMDIREELVRDLVAE
jgi:hypothetical protein